jgi:hypothetical protein
MAKARPIYVACEGLDEATREHISTVLREEHGAHGLRFLGELAATDVEPAQPELEVVKTGETTTLSYRERNGSSIVDSLESNDRRAIDRSLSSFVLNRLGLSVEDQTSRTDHDSLAEYIGIRPNLKADPSTWITGNPFVADLCRRYPQYGNMVRFLCNERGLFMKVGNHANQRAYWNSTLNGGLPAFKKADPVHEGTFMLHDLFHFVPVDPLLGGIEPNNEDKATYVAHRLLSEASTLVLADMVAVADARLDEQGYDVSKRKIFPVYESIVRTNNGQRPAVDKLLAANAYFCFTGGTQGFEAMGASEETLNEYRTKYESIFRDDFLWNLQNYDAMLAELEGNERIQEYYSWIAANTALPTLDHYTSSVTTPENGIDISKLLSIFRADFTKALNYNQPIEDTKRLQLAYQKYLAGQRVVFARFGHKIEAGQFLERFDENYSALGAINDTEGLNLHGQLANGAVDEYLAQLSAADILLPHEEALYRFSAPLYPIKFVNYEKRKDQSASKLVDDMQLFMHMNQSQLSRLLEAASV